ncbi:hypothetical protein [Azohydromonas aeria]|uniref:hypothetical protein n=1 Tax=Azohydromonas aeria TaxID=2590212 RepID=UPI0012FC2FC4|nr:hypothetical protein [Azohydromonas aeria]
MGVAVEVEPDGAGGEARPCAIRFGTRRVPVDGVLDRWHGRDWTWWKVATAEGAYVLVHDEASGEWALAAIVGEAPRDDAWPAPRRRGSPH